MLPVFYGIVFCSPVFFFFLQFSGEMEQIGPVGVESFLLSCSVLGKAGVGGSVKAFLDSFVVR